MAKSIVVCDFDGTVNRYDVGSSLLKLLIPERWLEIKRDFLSGKITNYQIYREVYLPLMKKNNLRIFSEMDRFLVPTAGFREFYEYCRQRSVEIVILSDGFDFYIDRFLKKYDFPIKYFSNSFAFLGNGDVELNTPYHSNSCEVCGTCKSLVLERLLKKTDCSAYVGDGESDICPSRMPKAFFGKRRVLKKISKMQEKRASADFYFYDFLHLKRLFEKTVSYRAVVFDLDGTLVDGFDIIYESFNYALKELNLETVPLSKIRKVIGPSLSEGFRRLVPEHLVERGVSLYRSYYKERYLERNKLFSGIPTLLKELKAKNKTVGLITNKKAPFAVELIKYLKLDKHFDFIIGADDGVLPKPHSSMMDMVLKKFDLDASQIIYVGDSEIDGEFANNAEVDFIAVGTGLGKERSLYKYRPVAFCRTVDDLKRTLSYLIPKNGCI